MIHILFRASQTSLLASLELCAGGLVTCEADSQGPLGYSFAFAQICGSSGDFTEESLLKV